jgi:hypothetical protein
MAKLLRHAVRLRRKAKMGEGIPSETGPQRRFRWLSQVWVPILCVVVASAATALFTLWITEWSGRLRVLQYYASSASGLISKPELSGKQIQVLMDGKAIDNISQVAVSLFNTTDQDYEDVPVEVVFSSPNGGQISLIQVNISTEREFYEEVPLPASRDGTLRFQYKFPVVNRSATNRAFFVANYFFVGDTAPTMNLNVIKKGLTVQQAVIPKSESAPTVNVIFPVVATISSLVALIYFLYLDRRLGKSLNRMRAIIDATATGNRPPGQA